MSHVALRRSNGAAQFEAATTASYTAPLAAVLSLLVAWVHLAYWESHWNEWWAYGLFFIAAGAAQALFAPAIVRWGGRRLALAGTAGNLAIVGMYVVSRTVGAPFGPHAGVAERAGAVDLITTATEIALIGVLLTMVGGAARRWIFNTMLLLGLLLWAMRLSGHLP